MAPPLLPPMLQVPGPGIVEHWLSSGRWFWGTRPPPSLPLDDPPLELPLDEPLPEPLPVLLLVMPLEEPDPPPEELEAPPDPLLEAPPELEELAPSLPASPCKVRV